MPHLVAARAVAAVPARVHHHAAAEELADVIDLEREVVVVAHAWGTREDAWPCSLKDVGGRMATLILSEKSS